MKLSKIDPAINQLFAGVVDTDGVFLRWQPVPATWLADRFPNMVVSMAGRSVFTGVLFIHLKNGKLPPAEFEAKLGAFTVKVQTDKLWGSNIKRGILTGYHQNILDLLLPIFSAHELSVRANSAAGLSGAMAAIKLNDVPVMFVEDGSTYDTGQGFELMVKDGINYIRSDHADERSVLRQSLAYKPFKLGGWRLGIQALWWITQPEDVEAVVNELEPYAAETVRGVNLDPRYTMKANEMTTLEQYLLDLEEANPLMIDHPLLNLTLSTHCASTIYDACTTGNPPFVQGFSAMPHATSGWVFPQKEVRYNGDNLALINCYPSDSPKCTFIAEATNIGPEAEFLNIAESFQNRVVCFEDDQNNAWFSKGFTVVVPVEYWPETWGDNVLVCGTKDRKAVRSWQSPYDVEVTQSTPTNLIIKDGYLTAVNWQYAGNLAMTDNEQWGKGGRDWDGDQLGASPANLVPQWMLATVHSHEYFADLGHNPKLPKVFTFATGTRAVNQADSIEGGKLVGVASNCLLLVLHSNPELWNEMAKRLGINRIFVQLQEYGYIDPEVEVSPAFELLYVLGFLVKVGTDCFKTNLKASGGLRYWSKIANNLYIKLRRLPSSRLLKFNPKKSWFAFRDNNHLPVYDPDVEVFGIAENMMKRAITTGLAPWGETLQLPEYFYLGAKSESFKWFAPPPETKAEIKAANAIRETARKELALRSMADSGEWVDYQTHFFAPVLRRLVEKGIVVYEWGKTISGKYYPVKYDSFPELVGISQERLCQLLWWSFHEAGEHHHKNNNAPTSIAPLTWNFPAEILKLVREMPGMARYQDEFTLPVIGLAHVEVPLNQPLPVEARIEKQTRLLKLEIDGEQVEGTIEEKRCRLYFNSGKYLTLPIEAPLLTGEFVVTLFLEPQEGKKAITKAAFKRIAEVKFKPESLLALVS